MLDRLWGGLVDREQQSRSQRARKPTRWDHRPSLEGLENRELLVASLAPIPTATVPNYLGLQVPLNGSAAGAPQTFTVQSSNPDIQASIAQGQFLTLNITHTKAAGSPTDISFSGPITFQLFQDLTPNTVSEIESFVTDGFYNGKIFHRVANGFPGPKDYIVQGGSKSGNGSGSSGQPGTPFPDEFNQQLAFTGTEQVAMANAGPDTNDTQFFFTTASPQALDFAFTIFGQIVAGQSILTQMTQVALGGADGTTPLSPITITLATLSATNPNGVVHIDATHANSGETATITVTANEATTHTTATQAFQLAVVPDTQDERPFVNSLPNMSVGLNQTLVFQIPAVSATPALPLGYTIQGGFNPATSTFTAVQHATATVDQNTGIVRVVPDAGFSGTISLLYGVRDASLPNVPSSYQWHTLTLTVNSSSTPVPLRPIAVQFTQSILTGKATPLQLVADNTNPGTSPTFTYSIVQQPLHGTITGFNQATGKLTYTPPAGYNGPDVFQYTVTATGGGQPTLTSLPTYVNLNIAPAPPVSGDTNAVNVIGNVLVVTPPPRTDGGTNTIVVSQTSSATNPLLQVTVNGELDTIQPALSTINRIIIFGSKANDTVTVDPSVTVRNVAIDGGHGGKNVLQAGGTITTLHGWFGLNTMHGGTGPNKMIGRAGHVKFKPSSSTQVIFAGVPRLRTQKGHPRPPGGTFFKAVNGRLVPVHRF